MENRLAIVEKRLLWMGDKTMEPSDVEPKPCETMRMEMEDDLLRYRGEIEDQHESDISCPNNSDASTVVCPDCSGSGWRVFDLPDGCGNFKQMCKPCLGFGVLIQRLLRIHTFVKPVSARGEILGAEQHLGG